MRITRLKQKYLRIGMIINLNIFLIKTKYLHFYIKKYLRNFIYLSCLHPVWPKKKLSYFWKVKKKKKNPAFSRNRFTGIQIQPCNFIKVSFLVEKSAAVDGNNWHFFFRIERRLPACRKPDVASTQMINGWHFIFFLVFHEKFSSYFFSNYGNFFFFNVSKQRYYYYRLVDFTRSREKIRVIIY